MELTGGQDMLGTQGHSTGRVQTYPWGSQNHKAALIPTGFLHTGQHDKKPDFQN